MSGWNTLLIKCYTVNGSGCGLGRVIKRVFDMAERSDADLKAEALRKMKIHKQHGTHGRRI